jgi:hypothetical protein
MRVSDGEQLTLDQLTQTLKSGTATSIDRPKAAGTLHIYAYDHIYDNKEGNNEWNRACPL